ncbi:MAG: hypothetical protein ACYT04_68010 [Nostoc sp.]
MVLPIKALTCVGWGATALGGSADLKQVAFEEQPADNRTINA